MATTKKTPSPEEAAAKLAALEAQVKDLQAKLDAKATPEQPRSIFGKKKEPETLDFSGGKTSSQTVKATKNIPLTALRAKGAQIPDRLLKRPGGLRIERGTEITASKPVCDWLRRMKWAA